ncbi:MAG: PIN domain-containing protein [Nanoarchaeota archaeon]|nr:PIN domain-containing protein [Nanoarchaeota archaeon]
MSKVVLDTNFVLNCIRNKLDFFEELLLRGDCVLIPVEVIEEIKRLRDSNKKLKFKEEANLALKMIEVNDHEKISAPGKYVDKGLIKYCKENPKVVLGTMDKVLKKAVANRKLVIRNKKKLELQ